MDTSGGNETILFPYVVTWSLVVVGMIITITIYHLQKANNARLQKINLHNSLVADLIKLLDELNSDSLEFWFNEEFSTNSSVLEMQGLIRRCKQTSMITNSINEIGFVEANHQLNLALRKAITDDRDIDERPINITSKRFTDINSSIIALKNHYKRHSA